MYGKKQDHRVCNTKSKEYVGSESINCTHLEETDGRRLLAEALTAQVKTVLANETGLVSAEAAA